MTDAFLSFDVSKTKFNNSVGIKKEPSSSVSLDIDGIIRLCRDLSVDKPKILLNNTDTDHDIVSLECGEGAGGNGVFVIKVRNNTDNAVAETLRVNYAGAIGITGTNFGDSGQVLTSNGAAAAASWNGPISSYIFIRISSSQSLYYGSGGPQYARLGLNTVVTSDPSSTITLDSTTNVGRISFANDGAYKIDFMFSADAGSTNRVIAIAQLRKNDIFVEPLECYAYCRTTSEGENTASMTAILDLSANDYIEIWVRRNNGNAASVLNKTGITIMKIH